jgi:hypothetical protein
VEQVASVGQVTELTLTGRSWTKGSMMAVQSARPGHSRYVIMELGSREGAGDHVCGFSESTDWAGLKKSTDSRTSQSYSRNGATIRAVSRLCSVHSIQAY